MVEITQSFADTEDGQQIAVWHIRETNNELSVSNLPMRYPEKESYKGNLLFIHGAFSDKRICIGIASYFANLGYNCFIMEWRGHGSSSNPDNLYHFEDVAFYDVKAVFDYLLNTLNLDGLHCVTHSGGGLCLTLFLARYPQYCHKIGSISMVACQAFGGALTLTQRAKLRLIKCLTYPLGYVPGRRLKLGPINESYYFLSQWMNWNLNRNFASRLTQENSEASQTLDYRSLMPNITTPIYAVCAKNDFVAPPQGCLLFLEAFQNKNNKWREFAVENGDLEDYNHTRIFLSRNAAKEVWPTVLDWIEKHSD